MSSPRSKPSMGDIGERSNAVFVSSFVPQSGKIKTLPEQLADKLVESIVLGVYAPGERLHEIALAKQYGVSRGPVREALRMLEREGLVSIPPRRGASVIRLEADQVRNIFAVRGALLALCSQEIAQRRPPDVISTLRSGSASLTRALRRGNTDDYVLAAYQVSMSLAETTGNKLAQDILFSLGRQTLSLTRIALGDDANRQVWSANWCNVMEAILDGDADVAHRATVKLVDDACEAALSALHQANGGTDEGREGNGFD